MSDFYITQTLREHKKSIINPKSKGIPGFKKRDGNPNFQMFGAIQKLGEIKTLEHNNNNKNHHLFLTKSS